MTRARFRSCTFVVVGSGRFPVDMLRYDRCCPFDQESVTKAFCEDGQRAVKLIAYAEDPKPEEARWRSFGWNVMIGSVVML